MITLKQAQDIVTEQVDKLKLNDRPVELYEPINYILSIGGKRIRPVLTLIACSMYSENIKPALMPAIGMEMFHNFTLIHDDIMDNANVRRSRPTVHAKWNNNVGILSGDAMCIKAYDYVMQCPPSVFSDIFWIFNRTALQVCEGQQFDMNFEKRDDVSLYEYLHMIELKTAVLLAACLQIGSLIGGASKKDSEILYKYGLNVGMAFQLQDDLLDVYGEEALFGKETGKDIISNKKTFLLIKALQTAEGDTLSSLKQWLSLAKFDAKEKVSAVRGIYDQLNIRKETQQAILRYFSEADTLLGSLAVDNSKKTELQIFADQIKKRIF